MRSLLAFIITVVIYILLVWLYLISFHNLKPTPKQAKHDNRIKISLKEFISPKKEPIDNKIDIKPKKQKLIAKRKNIKTKVKKKFKKTKIIKKNHKKITHKKIYIPESEIVYIPIPLFKKGINKNIYNKKKKKSYPNNKIKKLYGKKFFSYTTKQKKFIEQNLNEIHKITQRVLWQRGYPGGLLSARTGQEGINIVSFYLYPNGDITNLRLKRKIGYRLLDENTIETIKSAYKDYPYPTERTQIIFFVEYSIFGY
jgi:TonB family protein